MNVDLRVFWNTTDKWYGRTIGTLSKTHHSREMDWSMWYCPVSGLGKLTVACLSCSLHGPPVVHHYTSTILTGRLTGDWLEIDCQAFILLRDQSPSCSYLNITCLHCRFEIAGAGGILFMRALKTQNALAWPLDSGGIIWWILCFTAAVSEMSSRV